MNHQAIIDQLSTLAPQLKNAASPEAVLVKYAKDKNLSPAQLERVGQIYNIAKTLNFMDKSASRGDSFKVLDTEKMLADYTTHTPPAVEKEAHDDWSAWMDTPGVRKAASTELDGWAEDTDAPTGNAKARYLAHCKKAGIVPNIIAMASDAEFAGAMYNDSFGYDATRDSLPKASRMDEIKEELRKESFAKFELDSAAQVIDDTKAELLKLASDLLDMHKIENLPFSTMEADAFYSAKNPDAIKKATDVIADYFDQMGWKLDRHDFSLPAPKLARDRYNVLPILTSAVDKIETIKAANAYIEDFKKKLETKEASTAPPPRRPGPPINMPRPAGGARTAGSGMGAGNVNLPQRPTGQRAALSSAQPADDGKSKSRDDPDDKDKNKSVGGTKDIEELVRGIAKMYNPDNYASQATKDYLGHAMKVTPSGNSNNRQKSVDIAASDVGRIADLQRLMLSDPIIGEADPDTVVSLYNTLARANPEIAQDSNLLRFALREAIQYEAVPLHTYKDLVSMGKERAQTEELNNKLDGQRYSLSAPKD